MTEVRSLDFWKSATPAARNRLVLAAAGCALFIYAFFIQSTCYLNITGSPRATLWMWLWESWSRGDEYAHGFVIPLIAAGVAIWKWKKVRRATPPPRAHISFTIGGFSLAVYGFAAFVWKSRDAWGWLALLGVLVGAVMYLAACQCAAKPLDSADGSKTGLAVLCVAMLLYWVGVRATNPRILAFALIVMLFGAIVYLGGHAWAKELWFPCVFLFFMIPVNFLDPIIAFPLRLFVTKFSVGLLNLAGMEVVQSGTAIKSLHGQFQDLDVADPCSGIRSLIALMALTSVYGYVTMDKGWKKWVLFLSAIPLAVVGNTARIATIAFVSQAFGQRVAGRIYHDFSGFIVFSLATLCMLGISSLLNIRLKDVREYWLKEDPLPSDDSSHPPE